MINLDEFEPYRNLLQVHPAIFVAGHKSPVNENVASPTRELAEQLACQTADCMSAIVQLGGVIEDMQTTFRMLSRYPWHEKRVTKVQHLDLMWFLFQNLCYKFREKIKLYFNTSKLACQNLRLSTTDWLKEELSKTNHTFQREIRDRGNTVHSWNVRNPGIDMLSMASLFHNLQLAGGNIDLPSGFLDVSGHYDDAKWHLTERAKELIKSAECTFAAILESYPPTPSAILASTAEIIEGVNGGKITLPVSGK